MNESDKVLISEEEEHDLVKHGDATKHEGVQDNIRMKAPNKRFMDMKVDSIKGLLFLW